MAFGVSGLIKLVTSAVSGIDAVKVEVEVVIGEGKGNFSIIGLGDNAIKESRERVSSALVCSGYYVPQDILVNLAPAELKKEGSSFDLAIAVGILLASHQIKPASFQHISFHGELALDGTIKPVKGILAQTIAAKQIGATEVIVPAQNYQEASLITGIKVLGCRTLLDVIHYFDSGIEPLFERCKRKEKFNQYSSLDEVVGQNQAKRAIQLAVSGGHNLLMIGPPGCGKSMLAKCLNGLLPRLTKEELLEVVKIHSIAGLPVDDFLNHKTPIRSPHHVISDVGLVGGGTNPKPGEISLAHRGMLFLDEFPEFRRSVLESLRAPLENGSVVITRAKASVRFPANFMLVAAMNPCPCGRLGDLASQCNCTKSMIQRYLGKLSQPILDRIDIHVHLQAVPLRSLRMGQETNRELHHEVIQKSIEVARKFQIGERGKLNAELSGKELNEVVQYSDGAKTILHRIERTSKYSARGFIKVLKLALTISNMDRSNTITERYLIEAMSYRALERLEAYAR